MKSKAIYLIEHILDFIVREQRVKNDTWFYCYIPE